MSYQARLLAPEEWPRLAGTELAFLADPSTPIRQAQVVVVEDAQGAIIGTWALLPVWHVEGLWVDAAHRGTGSVLRRLVHAMRGMAHAHGVTTIVTTAIDPTVRTLLSHVHATPIPGEQYVMSVEAS
ncbi:MAG: hypothetical protein NTY02_05015 [Acidobacteria bacterium]|nr:hypothetical protein [Acidobacteriota bacterium]